ncbi:YNL040W [Zygosaccharomyces parabailii]|nr:YNL040W [Zygosaccharomyces parabailii]CDH13648.1 related to alanyl-tRNA editing protein alaX [Zygosaccharomyces bailii ISA1307]
MSSVTIMKPTVVGALACQRNSFLFGGFKTEVISCEPAKGKPKDSARFLVELQDTILFPEGGGQPSDSGALKCSDKSISVSHVSRSGLHAKHHVGQFIDPGTQVEVVVDEVKRLDYMQQHTGQHLLSAILENDYKLDTLSWSMGGVISDKKPTLEVSDYFNYIELPRKLTSDEINEVSTKVNEYISMRPQSISVVERTADSHGNVETSKIPEDYDLEKGILRTIHIGSLDANPCCGTHLKSTNQVGSILISPNQTTARGSNARLYFMCGNRVLLYGMTASKLLAVARSSLSCSEAEIPEKIDRQKDIIQKANKREQFWIKELAVYKAAEVKESIEKSKKAYVLLDEFGTLDFLLQVFKEFTNKYKNNFSDYQLVLCGREKMSESGSMLIISESGDKISSIADKLGTILPTLKGGGGKKGGKWQGKIVKFTNSEWKAVENYLEQDF